MHDRLSTSNGQGCANGKPIDLVLQRLRLHDCDLSLNGEGYKCRCPAHDDNSPSLSVKEGDDGTVLVHCFAGCNATAVVHSIDLELKDLFPPKPESAPKPKKARKVYLAAEDAVNSTWHTMKFGANKVKAIDASWWTYVVNSKPVMVMARFNLPDGDKEFRPFHPVPSGWSIGDPAGKLPLYRRDALDSATVVWVFEGEGCCDRVVALDLSDSRLIPTTSAHGAQSPHKTDWSPLAGKTVILCPDNDQAGEKYKDDVAGILSGLDPKPVIKVVRLPLATIKGTTSRNGSKTSARKDGNPRNAPGSWSGSLPRRRSGNRSSRRHPKFRTIALFVSSRTISQDSLRMTLQRNSPTFIALISVTPNDWSNGSEIESATAIPGLDGWSGMASDGRSTGRLRSIGSRRWRSN